MTRIGRWMLVAVALAALSGAVAYARNAGDGQNPAGTATPATQGKDGQAKPANAKEAEAKAPDLTVDQKAFNAIAEEKDAQKRVPLYEKFIEENPRSSLVSLARGEVQRGTLAALRSANPDNAEALKAKYLELAGKDIERAKSSPSPNPTQLTSTYSRYATDMLNANILLDQAEEFARQAVSLLDEQKYIESQKQTDQRMLEAFNNRGAANPPATPRGDAPAGPTGISIRTVNGAPVVQPLAPRPAPTSAASSPRQPTPPRVRTDEDLRTSFRSLRASNLATLGRVLIKRDKAAEGEKILKEAWDLNPPAATKTTLARALAEAAKKAGNEPAELEYLTAIALGGRITADEQKDFEAIYRKSHNGSLDGLDAMLDARYIKENPRFPVTPANRPTVPNQRAVLAENFTGSG